MKILKFITFFLLSAAIMTNASAVVVSSASKLTPKTKKEAIVMVTSEKPDFIITLSRNATTGYMWILENPEVYTFVEPVGYKYEHGDSKLIGSGGQDVWQFRVGPEYFKAPVTFQLHFIYARPWELKVGQEQIFNIVTMSG